jgi:hypothetical protein
MTRKYDAQRIIVLPAFDAGSASAVVTQLLAVAAKEKKLPAAVAEALHALGQSHAGLLVALGKTLTANEPAHDLDPERDEANAWSATEENLSSIMKLSDSKKAPVAARLHELLFADQLAFLRGKPEKRWSETSKRLKVIRDEKLAADFEHVGAAEFLAAIEAKHAIVGEVLGFTVPKAQPEPTQVKARFDEMKTDLRTYVLQLAASDRPSDPASGVLSARLQGPLTSYEAPPRNVAAKTPPKSTDKSADKSTDKSADKPVDSPEAAGESKTAAGEGPQQSAPPAAP